MPLQPHAILPLPLVERASDRHEIGPQVGLQPPFERVHLPAGSRQRLAQVVITEEMAWGANEAATDLSLGFCTVSIPGRVS